MYICFLLNLEDCRVEKSVIVEAVEDFNYLKNFEEADDKELFCLDIDEYENNRLFYDERDEIVTEEQLENSYKELKASGEFAGTFEAYLKDCCSKNGTLTEITKGENQMLKFKEDELVKELEWERKSLEEDIPSYEELHEQEPEGFWIIVNRNGERMWQFGGSEYEDMAMAKLIRAREAYPEAGLKLRWVED